MDVAGVLVSGGGGGGEEGEAGGEAEGAAKGKKNSSSAENLLSDLPVHPTQGERPFPEFGQGYGKNNNFLFPNLEILFLFPYLVKIFELFSFLVIFEFFFQFLFTSLPSSLPLVQNFCSFRLRRESRLSISSAISASHRSRNSSKSVKSILHARYVR